MVKIKFCGITNEKDALWAANMGVNYVGLNFFPNSPRKISVGMAMKIASGLPSFVETVGVFVDEDIKNILKITKKVKFSLLQLHGNESPEYCEELAGRLKDLIVVESLWKSQVKIIKAFRVNADFDTECLKNYNSADYFLLDTYVPGIEGGTGVSFNWEIAVKSKEAGKQIFLAGGLNPENVASAIERVNPFAVDVCSGIEKSPTRKDHEKMHRFIKAIRNI
ncbi:MAG: N-(5'-phosphoribosyl)anthranilate isomerase [Elusimicrobia bacterium ADurb.Bin231]|nr:MAG: N-(5'-phosphoribosyl)anthranilate isomerase [Elusimicrobia bacterium ADurb.Bin231]